MHYLKSVLKVKFFQVVTVYSSLLFLAGCSGHILKKSLDKNYEVTLYQNLSEIDHYVLTPMLDQLKVETLKPGETKKLLFKAKRKKARSRLKEQRNLEAVLARGSRPVLIQKIDFQEQGFVEADVTQLLETAKVGDRLIIASDNGEVIYKVTYFI